MTSNDDRLAKKLARVMRAARKQAGLTQQDVAIRLGISQGALSKIENGLLIPSAPQWFQFCHETRISPDSLNSGYLERNQLCTLQSGQQESNFRLPKRYSEFRGSKVRALLPLLLYFESALGEEKLNEYLRSMKLDPDFFVDLDNQISLNFYLDLSNHLIRVGVVNRESVADLVAPVNRPETHGRIHRQYVRWEQAGNLLKVLLLNSRHYECNFDYAIEDYTPERIVMSIKPEEHLTEFAYRDNPMLGDFLCQYKKHYFRRFTSFGGSRESTLNEIECHYEGADKCVYLLKAAS